jgi:hypothetical protein
MIPMDYLIEHRVHVVIKSSITKSLERLVLIPSPPDMNMYMAFPWHGV